MDALDVTMLTEEECIATPDSAVTDADIIDDSTSEEDKITYKDSTYEIVSKVAYLIGVPKRIFDNEHEAPKLDIYDRLEADKTARIIRHLCIIRTAIERNFKYINDRMRFEYSSIINMPEYVPQESLNQLSADGINFIKNPARNYVITSLKLTSSSQIVLTTAKSCFPSG